MSQHKEINTLQMKDWQASSLLELVKEHKKNCTGDCGVSLYLLFVIYKNLKGDGAIQDLEYFI